MLLLGGFFCLDMIMVIVFELFLLFCTGKCNPPKCRVHDFLKIFHTLHGLHFSWEHS